MLQKKLVGAKEASHILNISVKSVYRLVKRGLLKRCKAFRHILVTSESIDAFLKKTVI